MQALRAGKEQPCTTSPGPSAREDASPSKECAPSCDVCPNVDSCGTVGAVKSGAARISPESIRTSADIAPYIDHTLLKPEATREEVVKLSEEARKHGFATVCVNSVERGDGGADPGGLQDGAHRRGGLPARARRCPAPRPSRPARPSAAARKEIDMVINIGALKAKDYALVLKDIAMVVEASRPYPVKVILETSQLTHEEKIAACALSKAAGAAFVKTSTGFSSRGRHRGGHGADAPGGGR